jgi:hypothetical protein
VRNIPASRATVAWSNSAVSYTNRHDSSAPVCTTCNSRSNRVAGTCRTSQSAVSSPVAAAGRSVAAKLCRANVTWNSGERRTSRATPSSDTICSNGISWCVSASSTSRRVRARYSAKPGSSPSWARNTSMFTNMPTRSSSSGLVRPATGEPTAKSSCPASRASSTWNAASRVMNVVAPCVRPRAATAADRSASSVNRCVAPSKRRTDGLGRSVGSSSAGTPASFAVQYSRCRSRPPPASSSRCQPA